MSELKGARYVGARYPQQPYEAHTVAVDHPNGPWEAIYCKTQAQAEAIVSAATDSERLRKALREARQFTVGVGVRIIDSALDPETTKNTAQGEPLTQHFCDFCGKGFCTLEVRGHHMETCRGGGGIQSG